VALDDSVTPTPFHEVSAVEPLAPGRYSADLHANWSVGGKLHGGYILAVMARAAVEASHHSHVLAASVSYVSAPEPGPAEVGVEVLRAGRSAGQVRAWLEQDGELRAMALVTTGELDPDAEPYWVGGAPTAPESSFDASLRVPPKTPIGFDVPYMGEVDLRLDPSVLGFAGGKPSGNGLLHGWLQLENGQDFDPFSLLFAIDSFPAATLEVEITGWVPTIELTAYIRALPAPGPLQVSQQARLIEGQRVDEVCHVWDNRGRLVAQATQLAGIRLG
jgi:hypothetical protein